MKIVKLYHATNYKNIKKFKIVKKEKRFCELGEGVYFTSNLAQAKSFGKKFIYEIDIDLDLFNCYEHIQNEDFIYLCYLCRIGLEDIAKETIDKFEGYDIVISPVLAKVEKFTIKSELFNEGDIDYNEIKKYFKLHKGMNQYCLKTKKVLSYINEKGFLMYKTQDR